MHTLINVSAFISFTDVILLNKTQSRFRRSSLYSFRVNLWGRSIPGDYRVQLREIQMACGAKAEIMRFMSSTGDSLASLRT